MEVLSSYAGIGMVMTVVGVVMLVVGGILIFRSATLEEEKIRIEVENQYRNRIDNLALQTRNSRKKINLAKELNIRAPKESAFRWEEPTRENSALERTEKL